VVENVVIALVAPARKSPQAITQKGSNSCLGKDRIISPGCNAGKSRIAAGADSWIESGVQS
jgi:hypothetical protein